MEGYGMYIKLRCVALPGDKSEEKLPKRQEKMRGMHFVLAYMKKKQYLCTRILCAMLKW